jgi:hypothetical protein
MNLLHYSELLLKDSADEEELFYSDEDEVNNVQESDHNTETEESGSETEEDCNDVRGETD